MPGAHAALRSGRFGIPTTSLHPLGRFPTTRRPRTSILARARCGDSEARPRRLRLPDAPQVPLARAACPPPAACPLPARSGGEARARPRVPIARARAAAHGTRWGTSGSSSRLCMRSSRWVSPHAGSAGALDAEAERTKAERRSAQAHGCFGGAARDTVLLPCAGSATTPQSPAPAPNPFSRWFAKLIDRRRVFLPRRAHHDERVSSTIGAAILLAAIAGPTVYCVPLSSSTRRAETNWFCTCLLMDLNTVENYVRSNHTRI